MGGKGIKCHPQKERLWQQEKETEIEARKCWDSYHCQHPNSPAEIECPAWPKAMTRNSSQEDLSKVTSTHPWVPSLRDPAQRRAMSNLDSQSDCFRLPSYSWAHTMAGNGCKWWWKEKRGWEEESREWGRGREKLMVCWINDFTINDFNTL